MSCSPKALPCLCFSSTNTRADILDVSPLLLEDMTTGHLCPLSQVAKVHLCVCGRGYYRSITN